MHLIILTSLFGAKLNYESCMAKPKLTQNGEIWTTTVKKCLLGRFCEVMIWKRFYFINLRFLHFLVYATKNKRLPQPLETQNKSIILLFFAFLGVIFGKKESKFLVVSYELITFALSIRRELHEWEMNVVKDIGVVRLDRVTLHNKSWNREDFSCLWRAI